MQLARRDVIAALVAGGIAVGGLHTLQSSDNQTDQLLGSHEQKTLVAVAGVVYPSELTGIDQFVTQYMDGRMKASAPFADGLVNAIGYINEYTNAWYDDAFTTLTRVKQDEALQRMNADTATPDPTGSDVEQVRYFVINELLFALYASPTGGELIGIENPPGYPGGITSYQQGPKS